MNAYLGIDPGQSGALAVIYEDNRVEIFDYPGDERALLEIVRKISRKEFPPAGVVLEYQQAMPVQGVSSTFKLGLNYGIWLATLAAVDWPVRIVRPAEWKRNMGYPPKEKKTTKEYSLTLARRLYPEAGKKYLIRKMDHNRAEALLLAHYGKSKGGNERWME